MYQSLPEVALRARQLRVVEQGVALPRNRPP